MTASLTGRRRPRAPYVRRRWWTALTGAVLSLAVASLALGPLPRAEAAEVTDGLALWYKLDETSGTVAADSSGRQRNGTVHGAAGWAPGQGLGFNGANTYVKVPDNVMRGLDSISVAMDVLIDPTQSGAYFVYGFGNTAANGWGNGYLFGTGNQFRTTISTANWTAEQDTRPTPGRNLARGTWKHVTYTQTGSTGVLYEDGAAVARNENVTIKPSAVGGGTTTANYLGRSLYTGDAYFKGKIRDFRVYDRALTGGEVAGLAADTAAAGVAQDKAALTLGDTSAVSDDLKLPAPGAYGSTITFSSSNPSVLGHDGKVTRPPLGRPDATVTLTATLKRGAAQDTKAFQVKVLAEFDDSTKVNRAAQALVVPDVDDVRGNLTLPTRGIYGTTVTWKSDRPTVIGTDGVVHRPAPGAQSVRVNLIATVTLNNASSSRTFEASVRPLPAPQALKGYLFSYFTGEGKSEGEQIYLALSRGNDPLRFRELNAGRPVLTSTIGDKGVRDPFIIRSPEGDKFYQIATDLRIHGNWDWDGSQRTGSKSIMVWESTDLVNWTDQRLVKVSPDTAGNTWAPEAFYDPGLGAYVVFWASKIYPAADPGHTGTTHQRMMYATTRDFHTFSEPKPYIDENSQGQQGKSIIDTTMIEHDGVYYRYTKDEENSSKYSKMVFQQRGDGVLGTWRNIGQDGSPIPRAANGGRLFAAEGPTIFKSNTEKKWYLFLDDFGGGGYKPFETTDLDSGIWTASAGAQLPSSPRHGTVLPVTQAEYDRILRRYVPGELVDRIADVAVRTPVGTAPDLPKTVTATFADDSTKAVDVSWDAVPPSKYAAPGTFTVRGTIKESDTVRPQATVTVYAPDAAEAGPDGSGPEGAPIRLTGTAAGESTPAWAYRPLSEVDRGAKCTFADPKAPATTITCTDDGSYEVKLRAGEVGDTATVTVSNAGPAIGGVKAVGTAQVGRAVTVVAAVTDAGANDTHTCVVDFADGTTGTGTVADGTCSAKHTYRAAGSYDVTVTVTDDDGGASDPARLTIAVTPASSIDAGPDRTGAEGAAIALAGAVGSGGSPRWTYRAVSGVDTGATCAFADPRAARTTVTCTDDGTYEVRLTSGRLSDRARVTVRNAAPAIARVPAPAAVRTGEPVRIAATFTDAGNDTHTCSVDWRGATSNGTVRGGTCTAGHTYRSAGSYDVVVTVRDDDGASATRTVRVVVKAPGGGGGGDGASGGGKLPVTGSPVRLAAGIGLLLLLAGAVLLVLSRRRRRTPMPS